MVVSWRMAMSMATKVLNALKGWAIICIIVADAIASSLRNGEFYID